MGNRFCHLKFPRTDGKTPSPNPQDVSTGLHGQAGAEPTPAPTRPGPNPGPFSPGPLPSPAAGPNPGLWEAAWGAEADVQGQAAPGCWDAWMPGCSSGLLPQADLTHLLNCNSPWLRGAGPQPAPILAPAAAGCREPKGRGLAGWAGGFRAAGTSPSSNLGPVTFGGAVLRMPTPGRHDQGRIHPEHEMSPDSVDQSVLCVHSP
jgi:hypothetical protein